ncbi:hypothetical protein HMPREF1378_02405 [Enterococcus faecium R496]|uniref:Uncharacterized protein n=1 Tax=Enterococcus faecium R496 TaxID=1134836 RepID=A0AAV3GTL8_ENTFC|nr:hypothetical protein HMPREF1378_02405 [Enterococcus faecium R496]
MVKYRKIVYFPDTIMLAGVRVFFYFSKLLILALFLLSFLI